MFSAVNVQPNNLQSPLEVGVIIAGQYKLVSCMKLIIEIQTKI